MLTIAIPRLALSTGPARVAEPTPSWAMVSLSHDELLLLAEAVNRQAAEAELAGETERADRLGARVHDLRERARRPTASWPSTRLADTAREHLIAATWSEAAA